MRIKKGLSFLLAIIMVVSLITPLNVEAASKVKISKTSETMYVGSSVNLKIKGTNKKVSWSTSDKKVATVSSKGKVTAKKKGKATITAKVSGRKYTCNVTVKNPTLNKQKANIEKGKSITLKLNGSKVTKWSSSNTKVATVNKKGKVTAKKTGTATIKAKAKNGKTYKCKVTVQTKHSHRYDKNITKNATCTEEGTITYKCSCGATYYDTIPKTGHNFDNGVITTKETCIKEGVKTFTCTKCKITKKEKIAATGHNISDWKIVKDATCTEAGSKNKECTICHSILETTSIEMIDHNASDWIIDKAATCTEKGSKHKECVVCNTTLETAPIEMIDHNASDWIIDKKATCTNNGSKHKKCTICHITLETETITDGHSYDAGVVTTKPTCSVEGEKTYICSKCGSIKNETLDKLSHTTSDWIVDKTATCTNNGSKHKECTICHTTLEIEDIVTQGHSYIDTVVPPTCKEQGYTSYECSKCGESYKDAYTNILEHKESDWIIDSEATCTKDGSKHKECTICHTTLETEDIVTKGHSYVDTVVPPTCKEQGYTSYTCSKCGDNGTYEDSYTNALEHKESDWIIDKTATCTEDGSRHKECNVCHTTTKNETLDATGHTYGVFEETLAPADFETFGSANMVCPCGEVLFADLTAVKVDLGNGNSEIIYGYYDYDEAKECFDLTYDYLANHENATIVGWIEKYGFVWNEEKYKYACIRTAEMAWQFEMTEAANHKRPNGSSLGCGENLLYSGPKYIGVNLQPKDISAEEAFQKWLNSSGHKDNIEGGYEKMSSAQFKAWVPSKEGWAIFWVQNFY